MPFQKGDEVCATVLGWVESFDIFPGQDIVMTIVDSEGNLHSIQMKSSSATITRLSKRKGE